VPKIAEKLAVLHSLRLGYLTLGQAGDTLSTGERQRLRLARELVLKKVQPTLYVFDEPSAGLHGEDAQALLDLFFDLRDAGHSLWVIEHDEDLLACLDWRVDFAPKPGSIGGAIRSSAPIARSVGD
jgi:excinuclease ABC subunit A